MSQDEQNSPLSMLVIAQLEASVQQGRETQAAREQALAAWQQIAPTTPDA